VLLFYVLTLNLSSSEQLRKVKPEPRVIRATLVAASDLKPKPEPKPASKPVVKPKPAAKAKPRPQQKSKPAPQVKPKPEARPKPVVKTPPQPKVEPKPAPKAEPRMTESELAEIARADLSRAMAREEQAQAALTADEMTGSYAALIQQTVMNYWSRPPSARNGMEALLAIQLIPTGEVISVTLLKSSGSTAFDRSAINAVQKAGSFPELKQLPTREFEKTFRQFRLLFRPEDLRY
jgi:colicin import membrane protein